MNPYRTPAPPPTPVVYPMPDRTETEWTVIDYFGFTASLACIVGIVVSLGVGLVQLIW